MEQDQIDQAETIEPILEEDNEIVEESFIPRQMDQEPEQTYNNNIELVEEAVIANNECDPKFNENHDQLTTKSTYKEENANEISGSTFQTEKEATKHISGNLHDF